MGDRKRKFSHAEELDAAAALTVLEGLVEGLRCGELRLEHGEQGLILRPEGAISMAIEARHKPERESLTLSFTWQPAAHEPVFRIGAGPEARAASRSAPAQTEPEAPKPERGPEPPAAWAEAPDEPLEVDEVALASLPRDRLYALAKAVALEGRSQLPKRALARALVDYELGELLTPAERDQVRIK